MAGWHAPHIATYDGIAAAFLLGSSALCVLGVGSMIVIEKVEKWLKGRR